MCSHITATEYKFISLLESDNDKEENSEEKTAEKYKIWEMIIAQGLFEK